MSNRRNFIKQLTAVTVVGSMPSLIYSNQHSSESIKLLVRADDFGNSWGRSTGILKAHKEGIVTSTSIMVSSQFFEESVQLCMANPSLTVGIHITIVATRTRPVLSPELVPSILDPEGFFYESMDELVKSKSQSGRN